MGRSRQEALYKAEDWAQLHRRARRNYRDIRDLTARVMEITTSDWWIDNHPEVPAPIVVRLDKRSAFGGIAQGKGVAIRDLNDGILIHELAHYLTPEDPGHDTVYATKLLEMVYEFMGFMAHADLREGLKRSGYWTTE